jgi:hypothetical protein
LPWLLDAITSIAAVSGEITAGFFSSPMRALAWAEQSELVRKQAGAVVHHALDGAERGQPSARQQLTPRGVSCIAEVVWHALDRNPRQRRARAEKVFAAPPLEGGRAKRRDHAYVRLKQQLTCTSVCRLTGSRHATATIGLVDAAFVGEEHLIAPLQPAVGEDELIPLSAPRSQPYSRVRLRRRGRTYGCGGDTQVAHRKDAVVAMVSEEEAGAAAVAEEAHVVDAAASNDSAVDDLVFDGVQQPSRRLHAICAIKGE